MIVRPWTTSTDLPERDRGTEDGIRGPPGTGIGPPLLFQLPDNGIILEVKVEGFRDSHRGVKGSVRSLGFRVGWKKRGKGVEVRREGGRLKEEVSDLPL